MMFIHDVVGVKQRETHFVAIFFIYIDFFVQFGLPSDWNLEFLNQWIEPIY